MGRGSSRGGDAGSAGDRPGGVGTSRVSRILGQLSDLLLPGRCVGCGEGIAPVSTASLKSLGSLESLKSLVCPGCLARLRDPPWPRCRRCHLPLGTSRAPGADCLACREWPDALRAARWAVPLEPPADALVHGLKYEGWRGLSEVMARRMAALPLPPPADVPPDASSVVVPVPTTRRRQRRRGYNQARLLARCLAREWDLPLADALARAEGSSTQVALHPEERRANVRGAFVPDPVKGDAVGGRRVLLVDDVLTTGATAGEAASVLERAGAIGVVLVTFARSLPGRRIT